MRRIIAIAARGAVQLAFAAAIGALMVLDAGPSRAEGAVAIGMPEGDPGKGIRTGVQYNNKDANAASSLALKDCRTSKNPKAAEACKVIATFHGECFAMAVNGEPKVPITAAGWAFASDSKSSVSRAIAQCELMRKGPGSACKIDKTFEDKLFIFCDGSAK